MLAGYKLLVEVKLARELEGFVEEMPLLEGGEALDEAEEATKEAEVKGAEDEVAEEEETDADEPEKPYVEIKETPTGWLRVRSAPSTNATESGQVKPGETYSYLEEEENGWYKIEFEGKPGWISGTYADLID